MSFDPPLLMSVLRLAGFGLLGLFGGALYFYAVWRSARALAGGAGLVRTVLFVLARFILLGALLVFASRRGAGPLLAVAAGVLAARFVMTRRLKESAS